MAGRKLGQVIEHKLAQHPSEPAPFFLGMQRDAGMPGKSLEHLFRQIEQGKTNFAERKWDIADESVRADGSARASDSAD